MGRNAIRIPVAAKDDGSLPASANFQADVLFPVAELDVIKSFVERYPYLMNPRLTRENWSIQIGTRRRIRSRTSTC